MPEPTLATLLKDPIHQLDGQPDLLSGYIWDSPNTLNISAINEAARKLGIGPIFEIGDAPAWWSFPNLPSDHPNNQVRVDQLTVLAPDGRAPIHVQRYTGSYGPEMNYVEATPEKITGLIVSRLKEWEREARSKASEHSRSTGSAATGHIPTHPETAEGIPTHSDEAPQYVTLDQMAVLAHRSKKTLERWLSDSKLPQPDVEGGGGKPHEWIWSNVRESLSSHSGKAMPESYPTLRSP